MARTAVVIGSSSAASERTHSGERNGALAQIDGEIAHAFEVVVDFQCSDDQADVGFEQVALAQHADGVLVDQNFHFVDARLGEKYFACETLVSFEHGPQGAVHR